MDYGEAIGILRKFFCGFVFYRAAMPIFHCHAMYLHYHRKVRAKHTARETGPPSPLVFIY